MGNTCCSVHIALTGTTADVIEGIVRAYSTLGFERAETAAAEGDKHVILLRKEGDAFLSVYDSDNAALDTGELKDFALAASKIFKTAAVCTSLYDSDTFEIVVFSAGKQVDLVMTDPEQYSGPLKVLRGASRAKQWSKIFGNPLSVERINQAATKHSVFADDALAELSHLIGLTGAQSQLQVPRNSSDRQRVECVEDVPAMVQKRPADGHTAHVGLSSAPRSGGRGGPRRRGAGHGNERCVQDRA